MLNNHSYHCGLFIFYYTTENPELKQQIISSQYVCVCVLQAAWGAQVCLATESSKVSPPVDFSTGPEALLRNRDEGAI